MTIWNWKTALMFIVTRNINMLHLCVKKVSFHSNFQTKIWSSHCVGIKPLCLGTCCEIDICWASQEVSGTFLGSEGLLPCLQGPSLLPILGQLNPVYAMYATCTTHLVLLYYITLIIFVDNCKLWNLSRSLLYFPVTFCRLVRILFLTQSFRSNSTVTV
jgi:hypothetical protein